MKNALTKKFRLNLGEAIGGGPLSVVGYSLGRGQPATYIQGGIHGGEITYPIFRKLFEYLTNHQFKGTITLVPIANPVSWSQRLYFYTAGKFSLYDGRDWNRFFPGRKDGTTAERLAHLLFTEVKKHDFAIDLHTSRWSKPFLIIDDKKYLPLAKKMGISHTYLANLRASVGASGGPLSEAIGHFGIDGFTLECGSHDSMDPTTANYCFEVLLNALGSRGHFEHKSPLKPGVYYTQLKTYPAPVSGFVEYLVGFYQAFKKGDVLYRIYPSHDLKEVVSVRAQEAGVMDKHQPSHTALVGDEVVQIIPQSSIEPL